MSDSASDQYAKLLLGKCYGYPLWDPQPTEENSTYKRGGVGIGDVGFLDQGSFNYLFNIRFSRDHPINSLLTNPNVKASSFVHIDIGDDEIRQKTVAFPPEACVATKSIRKRGVNISEGIEAG